MVSATILPQEYGELHAVMLVLAVCRCSEGDVYAPEGAAAPYRLCPSPSASRLAASEAVPNGPAASRQTVQQALERALLQDNESFWEENQPAANAMDRQDSGRRNKLAVQLFLRLYILATCEGTPVHKGVFMLKVCTVCNDAAALADLKRIGDCCSDYCSFGCTSWYYVKSISDVHLFTHNCLLESCTAALCTTMQQLLCSRNTHVLTSNCTHCHQVVGFMHQIVECVQLSSLLLCGEPKVCHHQWLPACLVAGDIDVERLENPPIIIPTGAFWEGLEEYWSDLVNELPNIPDGGNCYFKTKLKPSLGLFPPLLSHTASSPNTAGYPQACQDL